MQTHRTERIGGERTGGLNLFVGLVFKEFILSGIFIFI